MTYSTRTMRPEDWSALKHFKPSEFRHPEKMGYEFMLWLDTLRARLGASLTISSSYRTPEANQNAGGASRSAHMDTPCDAVDFSANGMTGAKRLWLVQAALDLGCRRIGIYENGSVHLDMTHPTRPAAIWVKV